MEQQTGGYRLLTTVKTSVAAAGVRRCAYLHRIPRLQEGTGSRRAIHMSLVLLGSCLSAKRVRGIHGSRHVCGVSFKWSSRVWG